MTLGRSVRDGRNRRRSRLSSAAAAAEKAEAAAERGNRKGEREGEGVQTGEKGKQTPPSYQEAFWERGKGKWSPPLSLAA